MCTTGTIFFYVLGPKSLVSITYEIVSLYLLQLAIASRVGIFPQAFHISVSMNKNVNVHKDSYLH